MYHKYLDKEIKGWAKRYLNDDGTCFSLEKYLGVPHSTIWWSFQHKLADIDYPLYNRVMKRLHFNRSIGGRGKVDGTIVITSKQNIQLPKSLKYENCSVKKNMIVWKFKTAEEAIKAVRLFHNKGFEIVRRPI